MKVLLDARTATSQFPGTGRYIIELASALSELFSETGDELVLIINQDAEEQFRKIKNAKIIKTTDTPNSAVCSTIVASMAKELKVDVYHTPNRVCIPPAFMPTVLTVHDCAPLRCPYENRLQERIAYTASMKYALATCSAVIVVSEATCSDVSELFPEAKGKITVVRHGVSQVFKPTTHQMRKAVMEKYGYTSPSLLYIGNNQRHKNLIELFSGFARAQGLIHGVKLVLAGYGCTPLQRHERRMNELGITEFVNWIGEIDEEDLPSLIGSATAFVMPSLYEGFGLTIVEAMACGTPVACSDLKVFHEIAHDCATFFNPEDTKSIAQALVTVATDNIVRNRHRALALERVRTLKWDTVAEETRSVYENAIDIFKNQHKKSLP
jgi:glycosyltransferase involved in cell wall biosynthesis